MHSNIQKIEARDRSGACCRDRIDQLPLIFGGWLHNCELILHVSKTFGSDMLEEDNIVFELHYKTSSSDQWSWLFRRRGKLLSSNGFTTLIFLIVT